MLEDKWPNKKIVIHSKTPNFIKDINNFSK